MVLFGLANGEILVYLLPLNVSRNDVNRLNFWSWISQTKDWTVFSVVLMTWSEIYLYRTSEVITMDLRGTSHENNRPFPPSAPVSKHREIRSRLLGWIGLLQLAIQVVQTAMLESKSRSGTRQVRAYIILNGNFLCASVPVRLLLSSMAVLYHVNG